jgi:hypothetical protein
VPAGQAERHQRIAGLDREFLEHRVEAVEPDPAVMISAPTALGRRSLVSTSTPIGWPALLILAHQRRASSSR